MTAQIMDDEQMAVVCEGTECNYAMNSKNCFGS